MEAWNIVSSAISVCSLGQSERSKSILESYNHCGKIEVLIPGSTIIPAEGLRHMMMRENTKDSLIDNQEMIDQFLNKENV